MAAACKGLREGLITSSVVAQLPCGEGRRLEAEGELLCGWDCRDGAVLCWKGWVRKSYILGLVGLCLGLLLLQWPLGDSTQGSWSLWCWGKAPGTVAFAHSDRELRLIKSSGALSHPWEQLHGPCLEVLCNLGDFFSFLPQAGWLLLCCCVLDEMAAPCWMPCWVGGLKMCNICEAVVVKRSFVGILHVASWNTWSDPRWLTLAGHQNCWVCEIPPGMENSPWVENWFTFVCVHGSGYNKDVAASTSYEGLEPRGGTALYWAHEGWRNSTSVLLECITSHWVNLEGLFWWQPSWTRWQPSPFQPPHFCDFGWIDSSVWFCDSLSKCPLLGRQELWSRAVFLLLSGTVVSA